MALSKMSLGARCVSFGLAAFGMFASAHASATPTEADIRKARAQFQQGLALETAGDWPGALAIFQEVSAVKMSPQVRFNIALCEEHLGKLAMALGDYRLAASEADAERAPEVAAQAPGKVEALLARIPKVVVKRGAGADFATISLDGIALGAASVGGEMPIDPGPHTIEARAPGFNMFMTSFSIAEKEVKAVEVTLAKATLAGVHSPAEAPEEGRAHGRDAAKSSEPGRATNVVPYVVGGVGVASLVSSGIFFLLRAGAVSDLDAMCGPERRCPAEAISTFDKGRTYTTVADVTLGLGVIGLGTGAVLYFTQAKPTVSSSGLDASLGAPGALAGATVRARF
jgi:hypothetical protein